MKIIVIGIPEADSTSIDTYQPATATVIAKVDVKDTDEANDLIEFYNRTLKDLCTYEDLQFSYIIVDNSDYTTFDQIKQDIENRTVVITFEFQAQYDEISNDLWDIHTCFSNETSHKIDDKKEGEWYPNILSESKYNFVFYLPMTTYTKMNEVDLLDYGFNLIKESKIPKDIPWIENKDSVDK